MSLLIHWVVLALALWVTSTIVPGVQFTSWPALIIGAGVLGLVNAVVRPLLTILTLPITVLTLGLFYFVVNGIAFGLAAALVPGFHVLSLLSAILGALVTGAAAWVLSMVLRPSPGSSRHR